MGRLRTSSVRVLSRGDGGRRRVPIHRMGARRARGPLLAARSIPRAGSKDIGVKGAFVLEYRTRKCLDAYNRDNPGQAVNRGALYCLAWASVFAYAIAAPAIGVASGAVDCWREGSRARRTAYDHKM